MLLLALAASSTSAQQPIPQVRLLGELKCLLPTAFCAQSGLVGHTNTGATTPVALDGLLNDFPLGNLGNADDLNDAGPSDIADFDLVLVEDISDSNTLEKMSLGALRAYFQPLMSFVGLDDTPANYAGNSGRF